MPTVKYECMKNILIIGAGRSASALINYILGQAEQYEWKVTVVDMDKKLAQQKINNHPSAVAHGLNVQDLDSRRQFISVNDVIVSLLPPALHILVAEDCVLLKKHLVTASYVSDDIRKLDQEVRDSSLIFMGEMGLDPGIDHMSAMKHIHQLQDDGNEIISFKSYTGGLIAPESDDNPWHYKFTWNPMNVVIAGQGTAHYLLDGRYKYIPYHRLFNECETIDIPGEGEYEVYANRDSLPYRKLYGLSDIPTLVRGTIRGEGFCEAWNAFVQLGITDNSFKLEDSDSLTYRDFILSYVNESVPGTVEEKFAETLDIELYSELMDKYRWLGLFEEKKIRLQNASPAEILLDLLLDKWQIKKEDKDMILMQHEFIYLKNGKKHRLISSLKYLGKNSTDTAMSRLVGYPLGIITKLIMLGKVDLTGVNIPVMPEIYLPVLEELETLGVRFTSTEEVLD